MYKNSFFFFLLFFLYLFSFEAFQDLSNKYIAHILHKKTLTVTAINGLLQILLLRENSNISSWICIM